jgi:MobA/MobL family
MNKDEVQFVVDKNLPTWANNADEFFAAADANERANGRSYRSLVFAIPNEAEDKNQWAQDFTERLIGHEHTYRLAIHIPANGHNPHAHLMFSERGTKDLPPESFFSRANAKNPMFSGSKSKQWLERAKSDYLGMIQTLCPDYVPPNAGEQKIGMKLPNASAEFEAQRQAREDEVKEQRANKLELDELNAKIQVLELSPTEVKIAAVLDADNAIEGHVITVDFARFKPALKPSGNQPAKPSIPTPSLRPRFR